MYKYILYWLLIVFGTPTGGQGQAIPENAIEKLNQVDWEEKTIAGGIVWKYVQFEDLLESNQSITIFEVDLSNKKNKVAVPHVESGLARSSESVGKLGAIRA